MVKVFDETLLKFLLVGVVNTLFGCCVMFALYNLADCSYWFSSAANYVLAGILSFFLNKYFTFQAKGWSWGQVIRFVVNLVVCYVLAYAIAKPLVLYILANQSVRIQENIAMLVGMCLYTGLNYFGQKFFAFR